MLTEEIRQQQEFGLTYKTAGVNIDAGEELVRRIKPMVRKTFDERVLTDIGGFGGLFDARFPGMTSPVLVSSTGGVDRERMFRRENVAEGDILIGLPSSGLHTNGYSLARRALLSKYSIGATPSELGGESISDALLKVHRSYLKPIMHLLETFEPG